MTQEQRWSYEELQAMNLVALKHVAIEVGNIPPSLFRSQDVGRESDKAFKERIVGAIWAQIERLNAAKEADVVWVARRFPIECYIAERTNVDVRRIEFTGFKVNRSADYSTQTGSDFSTDLQYKLDGKPYHSLWVDEDEIAGFLRAIFPQAKVTEG